MRRGGAGVWACVCVCVWRGGGIGRGGEAYCRRRTALLGSERRRRTCGGNRRASERLRQPGASVGSVCPLSHSIRAIEWGARSWALTMRGMGWDGMLRRENGRHWAVRAAACGHRAVFGRLAARPPLGMNGGPAARVLTGCYTGTQAPHLHRDRRAPASAAITAAADNGNPIGANGHVTAATARRRTAAATDVEAPSAPHVSTPCVRAAREAAAQCCYNSLLLGASTHVGSCTRGPRT
jgi:hypothetical protein